MIALFLAMSVSQSASSEQTLALCKPALAHKAGSEIATMDVAETHHVRGRVTIEGRLTAYVRMGPAPAGSARANHIGRIDFSYSCTVRHGRVQKAQLDPFRP